MTDIDWSKAPESATHFQPQAPRVSPAWIHKSGGEFYCCDPVRGLQHIPDMQTWLVARLIPRPIASPWSGDGLPPVGASVVLDDSEHGVFDDYREMIGVPVVVTAAFKSPTGVDMIACALPGGLCGCFRADMARPGKTPAQTAAEEREAAAKAMRAIVARTHPAECPYLTLYDSGYRLTKGDYQ